MVAGGVQAACEMVQVKGEECQLPQMKGIEKVEPLRRVRNIRVIGNQNVIEMKGIVERRSEKHNARQNQDSRDCQRLWVVAQFHICAIVAGPIIPSGRARK